MALVLCLILCNILASTSFSSSPTDQIDRLMGLHPPSNRGDTSFTFNVPGIGGRNNGDGVSGMNFLKSTEQKIKTSTKETTIRLGFPSIEELSLPSVKMEETYSFDKGIDAKESKANTEKEAKKEEEQLIRKNFQAIKQAMERKSKTRRRLRLRRRLLQNMPPPPVVPFGDDDGDAHGGNDGKADAVVDDPEGTYEKIEEEEEVPCDDGMGPNPNLLTALPSDETKDASNADADEEAGHDGPLTTLERVVQKTIKKFKQYDLTTGRVWLKPTKDRIPMCPGAKSRTPIPGIDCTMVKKEKVTCCKCGCGGCCARRAMLRRVVARAVNKNHDIDMDTGRPFQKSLPHCLDYEETATYPVEAGKDSPLTTFLMKKITDGNDGKLKG